MTNLRLETSLISRLLSYSSTVVALALFAAGCATGKYGAFEPKGELAPANPTAYAKYKTAMAHHDGYQMAYEWQQANPKLVADATRPEVLAKFLETPAAADAPGSPPRRSPPGPVRRSRDRRSWHGRS